ncbi:MAG: hypothetical protein AAF512_08335, partial [Pseudomonadota bacterium]
PNSEYVPGSESLGIVPASVGVTGVNDPIVSGNQLEFRLGPEVNGYLDGYRESQKHVIENRESFDRAGAAIMSKIMENERAVKAMSEESEGQAAMPAHHAPDLSQEKSGA